VLVQCCSWSQKRGRFPGGGQARGPDLRLWARSGFDGHDLDTRLQSPTAPTWPGCTYCGSVQLVFGPGWIGLSTGAISWRMGRQGHAAGRDEACAGRRLLCGCVSAGRSLVVCSTIGSEVPPRGLWGGRKGWEKSRCYCRTTTMPTDVVTFLKALSTPFHPSPPEQRRKPWTMLGQAVAALLCRPLHGGTIRVAHGVPCRLLGSRLATTWSVGILGAMYTIVDNS
jgi:hypothetical protein